MIFGIGTDIVAVPRMEALWQQYGERFAQKILTPAEREELARAREPARFLAKRFAAKEAFAKALGTGLRAPASLQNIAVGHDDLGKPGYVLSPRLTSHLQEEKLTAYLSLSDERELVIAFAIIERSPA